MFESEDVFLELQVVGSFHLEQLLSNRAFLWTYLRESFWFCVGNCVEENDVEDCHDC